jgi:hypothetical protein
MPKKQRILTTRNDVHRALVMSSRLLDLHERPRSVASFSQLARLLFGDVA